MWQQQGKSREAVLLSIILTLLGSIVLVFFASILFVNALEWLGCYLKLGSSFFGAILSPIFTSMPELIVIMIAIFSNSGETGAAIGVGTIFGEPFMASSLSYGLVGIAVITGFLTKKRAGFTLEVDRTLALPYIFIIVLFPLTLIPGFIHLTWLRYFFGVFFLAFFLLYMRLMYRRRAAELIEECEELTFSRWFPESPSYRLTALAAQVLIAVAALYFGSRYLVSSVAAVAGRTDISALGLALIIIPAATAIPETITALIWGYRGKDTLSIGSLVGEKILYSTFYPALGLFLTSWILDVHAVFSVIVTSIISLMLLYFILRRRLPWYGLVSGLTLFVAYGILVFVFRI
jgi:cation:H+ antiporter